MTFDNYTAEQLAEIKRQEEIKNIRSQEWNAFTRVFHLLYGIDVMQLTREKIKIESEGQTPARLVVPSRSPLKLFDIEIIHRNIEVPTWEL